MYYLLNLSDGVKKIGLSEGGGVGVDLDGVTIGPKWLKLPTLLWLLLLLLLLVEVLGMLLQFPFSPAAAVAPLAFSFSAAVPLSCLLSRLATSSPMSCLGILLLSMEPSWPRVARPHCDSTGSLWLTMEGEEVTTWCVSQIKGYAKGDDSSFLVFSGHGAFDLKIIDRLKQYHYIINPCVCCPWVNNIDFIQIPLNNLRFLEQYKCINFIICLI